MKARLYSVVRDLHLYIGLFISPFVLVFSVSVFFLVHSWIPKAGRETVDTKVSSVALPVDLQKLSGRALVDALKPVLAALKVPGEIGFVRHVVKDQTLVIPIFVPGRATTVTISLPTGQAEIVTRETGLADALITLHKSPGPHGPGIRMNWVYMKVWRWLADATVYLLLFISASGLYLWYMLRAERRIGFMLLCAGTISFFALIYAISH